MRRRDGEQIYATSVFRLLSAHRPGGRARGGGMRDDSQGLSEFEPPFEVFAPAGVTQPVILNSPHSGALYPQAFLAASRLDASTLRRSEDAFVDHLFAPAAAHGAPLLRARFPRAFL